LSDAAAAPGRWNLFLVAASVAAAAVIVCAQLFVQPIVGLADNADYQRVMGYAGFQHTTADPAEAYFSYVRTPYAVVSPFWSRGGYHSSETLLAFAARFLHEAAARGPVFDLRWLGAIHALLFLLALGLLVRACRDLAPAAQLAAAALLVFFFTDVGYVAPFNSFYSQTASLLFLLLTAAVAAEAVRRGRLAGFALLAFFGFALLFVVSKPQEKLSAPLLALYGMRLAGVPASGFWRRGAVWLSAGLVAFSVWYGRHTPYSLREATMFQVVFDEILAHSADPAADAAALGLEPAWLRYTGANAYAPDSPLRQPEFRVALLQRVGYRRVLRFYAAHPGRLAARLERASRQAWSMRPALGNFEKSSAYPEPALATSFSSWSRLKSRLRAAPLTAMFLLLGGNLAAALATHRRAGPAGRLFREGVMLLVAMAALAFSVCALAQAPPDLSRQLYAYHALCDLMLVADAGWIAQALAVSLSSGRRRVALLRPVG